MVFLSICERSRTEICSEDLQLGEKGSEDLQLGEKDCVLVVMPMVTSAAAGGHAHGENTTALGASARLLLFALERSKGKSHTEDHRLTR